MSIDEKSLAKRQLVAGISSAKKKVKRVKRQLSSLGLFNEAKDMDKIYLMLSKTQKSLDHD
jgi:hypothetical protein